jgi:hypothetical protein
MVLLECLAQDNISLPVSLPGNTLLSDLRFSFPDVALINIVPQPGLGVLQDIALF